MSEGDNMEDDPLSVQKASLQSRYDDPLSVQKATSLQMMYEDPLSVQKTSLQVIHAHHNHRARQIHGHGRRISAEEGYEEEELDPRIQVELEKLNRATEEINRLELELDDARAAFRQVLSDSTQRLNGLAKKLGACVDKARPYYDSRMRLKEAHLESQKAAIRFERACSMHEAAKEMVQLAEEGYKRREEDLDPTWQEMLNHATMKVNDAERERMESEDHHQRATFNFKKRDEEVQKLQKDLKRVITKSKPYFEMKAKFNQVMEDHKRNVSRLEEDVASTKALYSEALRSLEAISDDIHRQRLERRQKMQLGVREAGVGAESPSPPSCVQVAEGSVTSIGFHNDSDSSDLERNLLKENLRNQSLSDGVSLDEDKQNDTILDSDPLNVVVFKQPRIESKFSSQLAASLHKTSTGICNESPSTPLKREVEDGMVVTSNAAVERGSNSSSKLTSPNQGHTTPQSKHDVRFQPQDVYVKEQSSISRAQEWVNKSPIPQQRRFVKSKSLIDACSPSAGSESVLSLSPFSSSLTNDAMKLLQAPKVHVPGAPRTSDSVASANLVNRTFSSCGSGASQSSPRSLSPEQPSSLSGSPNAQRESSPMRKSPKLQGLILRVDTESLNPHTSPSPSYSRTPVVNATSVVTKDTSVIISTNLPELQVLSQRQQQLQQQSTTAMSFPMGASNAQVPITSGANPSATQFSSYPSITTSAIPSSVAKVGLSKVSNYASRTAPSAFQLPSPTRTRLSVAPPIAHRQTVSPTPSSPSGDRFSIASGRSDSLSASNRGSLLKVPSDSSDTESIASTGPMLDDDQVEYLTMDFNEHSITSHPNEEDEISEYMDEGVLSSIQRGHWSRMSLPPRLSYLEGYLDRARHISSSSRNQEDNLANEELKDCREDDMTNDDDRLSVEASVDQDGHFQEDQDLLNQSPSQDGDSTLQASHSEHSFSHTADVDLTVTVDCPEDNSSGGNEPVTNLCSFKTELDLKDSCYEESVNSIPNDTDLNLSENKTDSSGNESKLKTEATVILSASGNICDIKNKDSDV